MEYIKTEIEGVWIIEPRVFNDQRGYFFESYKQAEFDEHVDVAVDIRKSSPTFGKYVMVELSEDNKRQFFIPRGFAHGFLVLSDEAIFTYKVDNVYAPQAEASIRWDDETIGIKWPIDAKDVLLSDKDLNKGFALKDAKLFE